jgi:hypothetical protein
MSDQALMQAIKTGWGEAIAEACKASSVPESFVAALIANESGGHNDARRFEPKVLSDLWEVLLGRKTAYGSIGRTTLVQFVAGNGAATGVAPKSLPADAFQRFDGLATSWGLTQVMGYHVLGTSRDLDDLKLPEVHLPFALQMLAGFAEQFSLDVTKDFSELFRCWNTGRPDGATFDPDYVNNGLVRIAVWTTLT